MTKAKPEVLLHILSVELQGWKKNTKAKWSKANSLPRGDSSSGSTIKLISNAQGIRYIAR